MIANIRRTCQLCGKWTSEVLCDDCLDRIERHFVRDDDIDHSETWIIAYEKAEAEILAERSTA